MQRLIKIKRWFGALSKGKRAVLLLVVAAVVAYVWFRPGKGASTASTFTVRRGPLPINIIQAGNTEALESQEVRSEVKGYQGTKILSIVEEGYHVTEEDLKNGKVLVELDSSEMRQRLATVDIDYQSKFAMRTDAQQAYEIQVNQNAADIKAAEQKMRFGLLDMEKYLGAIVTKDVIARLGLEAAREHALNGTNEPISFETPTPKGEPAPRLAVPTEGGQQLATAANGSSSPASANALPGPTLVSKVAQSVTLSNGPAVAANPSAKPVLSTNAPPPPPPQIEPPPVQPKVKAIVIEYSQYAKVEMLGDGEAQQKLRENKDALLLAEKERGTSQEKLTGTERLYQKGFVTRTEYENDKLGLEQAGLKVQKAQTTLNLFTKYDFPKAAEELVSKYEETVRTLEKTRKESVSKLAQSRAKMMSAETQFRLVSEQRKDLLEQLEKCTIRAKKSGLVIYGGTSDGMYYYGEERIREGALVRERQPIITIPDMTRMAAKLRIHESHIKKVKVGMKARIRLDAFSDKTLTGEVIKVGVLPDTQSRYMNPDMKMYLTTVRIDGAHEWLKPGLSGKVEILVDHLKSALQVPMQAVVPEEKEKVCYVMKFGKPERRVVTIGQYNDEFIEIVSGLNEGEKVMLRLPEGAGGETSKPGDAGKDQDNKTPEPAPATPASAGPKRKA